MLIGASDMLQETECSGSLVMKMSASKDLITVGDQLSDQEVLGKHKALSHTLSLKSILGKSGLLGGFGLCGFGDRTTTTPLFTSLIFTNGLLPQKQSLKHRVNTEGKVLKNFPCLNWPQCITFYFKTFYFKFPRRGGDAATSRTSGITVAFEQRRRQNNGFYQRGPAAGKRSISKASRHP